ncbi:hypothetical protein BDN71DRAFT_1573247 [Pleurotus eryngii]|uniref:Uncharacterized protein n=1 Tax=Pleurotus eryngii TaxID=5323 RepID=A0A9P6DDE7_PLEER|nr:hypothetical protein BDN71DRAFT_1573247 [Pleurotus eryngii]
MGQNKEPTLVTLSNVWYSPEMAYTLISVQTIVKTGHRAHFEGNLCTIINPTNSRVIGLILLINGLYRVTEEGPQGPVAAVTLKPITISELH